MTPGPMYVAVGHTFIDDVVFPTGKTFMAVLGGGGVHAAAGMLVWDEHPGIIAAAGRDMPSNAQRQLQAAFDARGIAWVDVPQLRGWQLFEEDGRRTEVLRMVPQGLFADHPVPEMYPAAYADTVRGMTILNGGAGFMQWRDRFPDALLLWEPGQAYMRPENRDEFCRTLPFADIISPNLVEAQAVYGREQAPDLVRQMLRDGARVVALRMGDAGSLVGEKGRDALLHVPPIPVSRIIDQTGAGNAYCGGFLVGWHRTGDLLDASCYGAVSASFALEYIGPIKIGDHAATQRDKRYTWLRARIEVEPLVL